MKKWKLTVLGTGKMGNSPKHIDETFEIDEKTLMNLRNPKSKSSVLESLLTIRIPGIIIDTNKLQINTEEISKPLIDKKLGSAIVGGIIGAKIAGNKKKRKNKNDENYDDEKSIPFDESLKEIITYQWNGDLSDTINKLKNISLLTTGYEWEFNTDEIGKENNRLLSQCLKQYNIGYKSYKKQIEFKEIKAGKTKLTLRKIKNLYGIFIVIGIAMLVLIIMSLI
jgi:hypothetical protein